MFKVKVKTRQRVVHLNKGDSTRTTNDQEKPAKLDQLFQTMSTHDAQYIPGIVSRPASSSLIDISFTIEYIMKTPAELEVDKPV